MRWKRTLLAAFCTPFVAGYAFSALQDAGKKPAPDPAAMMAEMMPKPGPEHARFAKSVGIWDAEMEMAAGPAGGPSKSKGVETVKLLPGGLWLVVDYEGSFMGMPFHGHAVTGFDTTKGKVVGTWVDSMSTEVHPMEGTYDEKTRTQTCLMESRDMTGQTVKQRLVDRFLDDDTRVFQMMMPGPDGKEVEAFKITYRRRR